MIASNWPWRPLEKALATTLTNTDCAIELVISYFTTNFLCIKGQVNRECTLPRTKLTGHQFEAIKTPMFYVHNLSQVAIKIKTHSIPWNLEGEKLTTHKIQSVCM